MLPMELTAGLFPGCVSSGLEIGSGYAFRVRARRVGQKRRQYTSYKVANMVLEFSTSIPRAQLRPGYGDGFLGAPLQTGVLPEQPPSQPRGGRRGTSSPPTSPHAGDSHHV
jgi:hypothetical protein